MTSQQQMGFTVVLMLIVSAAVILSMIQAIIQIKEHNAKQTQTKPKEMVIVETNNIGL
jgi:cell division protein FtsN